MNQTNFYVAAILVWQHGIVGSAIFCRKHDLSCPFCNHVSKVFPLLFYFFPFPYLLRTLIFHIKFNAIFLTSQGEKGKPGNIISNHNLPGTVSVSIFLIQRNCALLTNPPAILIVVLLQQMTLHQGLPGPPGPPGIMVSLSHLGILYS